jgi:hypothetical protein
VVASEERAQRMSRSRTSKSEFHRHAALARLVAAQQAQQAAEGAGAEGELQAHTLPVIVKADVQGSAEAVRDAIANLSCEQVSGAPSEGHDVQQALWWGSCSCSALEGQPAACMGYMQAAWRCRGRGFCHRGSFQLCLLWSGQVRQASPCTQQLFAALITAARLTTTAAVS